MLNHADGSVYFSSFDWWLRNRGSLIFRDETALLSFQDRALRYLRLRYKNPSEPVITQIPACTRRLDSIVLKTSGTMSSVRREYAYPLPQYRTIEEHHWWRIEKDHGLTDPGIIVEFFYNPRYVRYGDTFREINPVTQEPKSPMGMGPEDKLYGPRQIISLGSHNSVYHMSYNRFTNSQTWSYNLEKAAGLRPKLVVMSPSQFQTAWFHTKGFQFDCPVVMTREVLDKDTRQKASRAFTKVVDKMRCWDGGLGFYECSEGRRHIYDELAIVREEEGRLISTDLFNYCHPFINYWNGDMGKIDRGLCSCGVYGTYLVEMNGRVNDAIVIGDVVFPGSVIVEEVSSFFRYGGMFTSNTFHRSFYDRYPEGIFKGIDCLWKIHQRGDQTIEFRYMTNPPLTPFQEEAFKVAVRFMVGRDSCDLQASKLDQRSGVVKVDVVYDESVYGKTDNRSKTLCVTSDAIKVCCR